MFKTKMTLGIDIGGTNTVFGFVDNQGHVIIEKTIPTEAKQGAQKLFSELAKNIKNILTKLQKNYEFMGVGIGAPNANYFSGSVENPPNLSWGHVNIVEAFQKHFDIPVFVTNDANATAIGEMLFGAARGMKNFIVLTLGTGLGSGIVIDGKLVYGEDGFAGELGHTCVEINGRQCGCGNKGCLEAYVSATGIKKTVFNLLGSRTAESALRDISYHQLTAKKIAELANHNDPIALEAFQFTGKLLGLSMANAVAFSRPEAIILFGGLAAAGELLLAPTRISFEEHLLGIFRGKIKILKSGLEVGNSAVLGAAALAWSELETKKLI